MAADYNTKINFHYSSRDMIYEKDIYPPLLELIKESNGEMLFVDSDDKFPYGKPQTDEVARGSGTESMAVRD